MTMKATAKKIVRQSSNLPVRGKLIWIPSVFLHAASINCSDPTLHTIDSNLIGSQPHNRAILPVGIVGGDIVAASEADPENPAL